MIAESFERRVQQSLGPGRTPEVPPVEQLWARIDAGLPRVPRRSRPWRPLLAVAATALLVIVATLIRQSGRRPDPTVRAANATERSLAVIDSALARLRPDSQSNVRAAAQMLFLAEVRADILTDFPVHPSGGQVP